ncbi:putative glutamine--tRNA ligase [Nymphon striatum]|nr:putative glutamine--tRNA ligase [Nymphon striatum]
MAAQDQVAKLLKLGLSEKKAEETLKNTVLSKKLLDVIDQAEKCGNENFSKQIGTMLYHLVTDIKPQILNRLSFLIQYICEEKLDSKVRLSVALDYLLSHQSNDIDIAAFEEACGIGVVITPEEIEKAVEEVIQKHCDGLTRERYRYNIGKILADARSKLKWADGKCLKNEVDIQVICILGPKTDEDNEKPSKKPNKKKPAHTNENTSKHSDSSAPTSEGVQLTMKELLKTRVNFHKPGENFKTDGYVVTPLTMELTKKHLEFTEGKVRTRFPPEPNGLLHIGHAKAININFGYAAAHDGTCFLRYDDTNPEKEEEQFFVGIKDMVTWLAMSSQKRKVPENGDVSWKTARYSGQQVAAILDSDDEETLGFDEDYPSDELEIDSDDNVDNDNDSESYKPQKITHSSDYFDKLYELAKVLIKKDLAYICHQKAEDIKGFNPPPSPYRNRPVEENFILFEDMKNGKFDEGEATLRMKLTLEEGKLDPVCYRIKYSSHHRTGDKWCIYPTYDFTHCLCDSLEHITHSLCTKEFQSRRSSYYWLCNAVDIYCPVQWEYGRLNMNYTVISKRKIAKLISNGIVRNWDDPRLFTLTALRRRGFPAEAINNFCAQVGLTMAKVFIDPQMLDACVRDTLNTTAPRAMAVLEPIRIRIENFKTCMSTTDAIVEVDVPNFPSDPTLGYHKVPISEIIYIEKSDFKEIDEKGYRRLTPTQSIGLKHAGLVLTISKIVKENDGSIQELVVHAEKVEKVTKPKAFIHWVSNGINCEVRLYGRLFNHKNPEDPAEVPGGFLTDCNKDSLKIIPNSLVDVFVKGSNVFDKYQFERVGFFSVDPDSTKEKLIFNRTVSLKEDNALNKTS